ncbi:MAG: phytanoyl-CoA dioxygenase family protein [Acidobacteriota bacterium]
MSFLDFLSPRRPSGPLSPDGRLWSDLWLDQRDAKRKIARRVRRGELDSQRAEQLRHYAERGYLVLSLDLDDEIYAQIERDVESLWHEQPEHVAYAYHSLLTPFCDADMDHRKPSCRIADLHTWSETALGLFLHRQIFDLIDEIFGETSIATQSLYFEWGSQQGLHRDPVYVNMTPPYHLAAAWVALEDIGPDCGPLIYYPGSHRLPYYQFAPGRYQFDHSTDGDVELAASQAWDERHVREAGLECEQLTCRRGDVLIWHHSLLHGGARPKDPSLTRKSFVVHYTTRASMPQVLNSYVFPEDEAPRVLSSDKVMVRDGCHGFDSPLNVHAKRTHEGT